MTDPEISLDPEDWDSARAAGHRMLDDLFDQLETLRERAVWQPLPGASRSALHEPLPRDGASLDAVYATIREHVMPYPTGNIHPRFFGWVMGNGTVEGMLADLIASGLNPHLAGYDQSASVIEGQVIDWFKDLMGYPEQAGGLFVSGGTMANIIGIVVGRNAHAALDVRHAGLAGAPQLCVYGSSETHSWAEKGCDLIGMGRHSVRRVAADVAGRIDLAALAEQVAADREAGHVPLAVIGNVATVDGGAIDDLPALADYCARESLWFHVDGAFGAWLAAAPGLQHRVVGMERADSIAFDLHKWGFLQYDCGAVLVKDAALQHAAFATDAAYLKPTGRGIQPTELKFAAMGPQLSRGFRAFRAWVSIKHHGIDKIGRVVAQNVAQAQHLAERVRNDARLELFEPSDLNIVCFRFVGAGGVPPADLDELNREVLLRIQESGLAVPSSTVRQGHFALRVAITNHRTIRADLDLLADAVLEHGEALAGAAQTE